MTSRSPVPSRTRAVPRTRVAAVTLVVALVLGGVVWLAEVLRHPLPGGPPRGDEAIQETASDPRDLVECAEALPREGQERVGDAVSPAAGPVEVTSSVLYDCPQTYAGARVRYEGEVVGAVLRREDGAWVHLNDDVYADALGPLPSHRDFRGGNAGVGVFVPLTLATEIAHVGGPGARGDLIAVEGVFRRVDPRSGEVAIIRADVAEIVRAGEPVAERVMLDRRIVAALVALLTLGLFVAERVATSRAREAGAAR